MLSVTESSSDFDQEREERMKASDGSSEAALERSLSEWIPLDVAAATVVLREASRFWTIWESSSSCARGRAWGQSGTTGSSRGMMT
jgi:hypothetical protein